MNVNWIMIGYTLILNLQRLSVLYKVVLDLLKLIVVLYCISQNVCLVISCALV